MNLRSIKTYKWIIALAAIMSLAGCSSGVTRPDGKNSSSFVPSSEIPIGKVSVTMSSAVRDKLKDNLKFSTSDLGRNIEQSLQLNELFAAKPDGISLEVLVTNIRIRSTFNAVMWGAMAGNDALEGEVTIKDSSGKILDGFTVSSSYALGGFAGGQDSGRMGWLYEAFAKEVTGQFKPEQKTASR
ncbi:MAG: DUF4410 domain-containing protein [Steroidobacteraceae bacterium]